MKLTVVFKQPVDEFTVVVDGNKIVLDVPAETRPLPWSEDDEVLTHRVAQVNEVVEPIKEVKRRGRPPRTKDLHRFEEWYALYPRKTARGNAEKAWRNLNPNDELVDTMIRAVTVQAKLPDWTKDGGSFTPHPATWLNGKRWLDEVPAGVMSASSDLPWASKPWGAFIVKGELVEVLNLMSQVGLDDPETVADRLESGDSVESVCDWLWGFRNA